MSRRQLELYRSNIVLPGGSPDQKAFRMSLLDLGGQQKSDIPTAIFLHGAGGNMIQWHYQLAAFQGRMRCVAIDMRGHGLSEFPDTAQFEMSEFVQDVSNLLEVLKIEKPFYLLGHSFGGAVAAAYAAQYSDHLKGLVLMATSGKIHLNPYVNVLMKLPATMLKPIQRGVKHAISSPPVVLKKLVPYVVRWRGWDLYPKISCPTLGIAGELDWLTRPASMKKMIDLIPGAWLERISFSGHLPQLERPKRTNQILESFLFPATKVNWRGQTNLE